MTNAQLIDDYFLWLTNTVCDSRERISYSNLLTYLFDHEFTYILHMDANRAIDGIDLRYRYGRENDIPESKIKSVLDIRPCSLLEMLVALSLRIEETIMDDPDEGNRTDKWFWMMIKNLGLKDETDDIYDEEYVEFVINRFLERLYDCDGKGGLVHIKNPRSDLRYVEIWYQLMWYLSERYL